MDFKMKFDDFLNSIFRKGGLLIILFIAVAMLALSGCLLTETLACICYPCGYMCGCDDMCSEACWACGEQWDDDWHYSFYTLFPEDCPLGDCLFGDGCQYESDGCAISCGGLGNGFYSKTCRGEHYNPPHGEGCLCTCGYCEMGCDDCYFRCGQDNCGD